MGIKRRGWNGTVVNRLLNTQMIGFWILACLAICALGGPMESHMTHHHGGLDSAEIHSKHQLSNENEGSPSPQHEDVGGHSLESGETSESDESNETLSAFPPSSRSKRQAPSYIRSYPNPKSYLRKQQRTPRDYCDYFDDSDGGYAYCRVHTVVLVKGGWFSKRIFKRKHYF